MQGLHARSNSMNAHIWAIMEEASLVGGDLRQSCMVLYDFVKGVLYGLVWLAFLRNAYSVKKFQHRNRFLIWF